MIKIYLGSASPRRKELLKQIGLEFDIVCSDCEETITSRKPDEIVLSLSAQKAEDVFKKVLSKGETGNFCVIGADTVVAHKGQVLGKPKSEENAFEMLTSLQGKVHQVFTGVDLILFIHGERIEKRFYETTHVHMYPMTEDEIRKYIATGEPMDKAGAYGIQGKCAAFIEKIEGDYNNVVGLPVARVYQNIKRFL